jgi:hypothetical protein
LYLVHTRCTGAAKASHHVEQRLWMLGRHEEQRPRSAGRCAQRLEGLGADASKENGESSAFLEIRAAVAAGITQPA